MALMYSGAEQTCISREFSPSVAVSMQFCTTAHSCSNSNSADQNIAAKTVISIKVEQCRLWKRISLHVYRISK